MSIAKYLLANEHITSSRDVIYIFFAAFPREICRNIRRELINQLKQRQMGQPTGQAEEEVELPTGGGYSRLQRVINETGTTEGIV